MDIGRYIDYSNMGGYTVEVRKKGENMQLNNMWYKVTNDYILVDWEKRIFYCTENNVERMKERIEFFNSKVKEKPVNA